MTSADLKSLDTDTQDEIVKQPLTMFAKFRLLPFELRLEIWKMTFRGRRVLLWGAGNRPAVDKQTRRLLYVNREAAQVYKENYIPCFYQRGRAVPVQPLVLNFELDTLCFEAGVKSLRRLLRQYPEDMSKTTHMSDLDSRSSFQAPRNGQKTCISPLQKIRATEVMNQSFRSFDWTAVDRTTYTEADDFNVIWVEQNGPWTHGPTRSILTRMENSQTPHSRQGLRDFWDLETSSYYNCDEKLPVDHEYDKVMIKQSALSEAERNALNLIVDELWVAMEADKTWSAVYPDSGLSRFPQRWCTLPFVIQAFTFLDSQDDTSSNSAPDRAMLRYMICLYPREFPWVSEEESVRRILEISHSIPPKKALPRSTSTI
ncbi:hypothetical protein BKA64DRAFT_642282 [Cadophora sp. MPI-SDFR-AT-0126]|nr:hypothetical protein BKA64DRAFT_642282 [Leotiomycetes sp. MPI-SDFR-AT-0126]